MIHVQRQSIWREFYDFNLTIEFTKSLNLKLRFPSKFRIGKIWYSKNVVDLCMDYWLKLFTSLAIEVLPLFSCDETVLTSAETLLINKWWVWEKKKGRKTIEWEAWVLKNKGASSVCGQSENKSCSCVCALAKRKLECSLFIWERTKGVFEDWVCESAFKLLL